MHPEAHRGVARMIDDSGIDLTAHSELTLSAPTALDIGGADVNGSACELFEPHTRWYGLDVAPGPGVDIVADATEWRGEVAGSDLGLRLPCFDIVLCTEVLEHVEKWPLILDTIHAALVPGGHAFVTFASEGRRPHGARGELDPPAGEWYRNVSREEFRLALLRTSYQWADFGCVYNPNPGDIYAWLRK